MFFNFQFAVMSPSKGSVNCGFQHHLACEIYKKSNISIANFEMCSEAAASLHDFTLKWVF